VKCGRLSISNRKSYKPFQTTQKSSTLDDLKLEGSLRTLNANRASSGARHVSKTIDP